MKLAKLDRGLVVDDDGKICVKDSDFLTRTARFLERENFQFGRVDAISVVFCFVLAVQHSLWDLVPDWRLNLGPPQ